MAMAGERKDAVGRREPVSLTIGGKFEVVRPLVEGERGARYLALDRSTDRRVVILHTRPGAIVADPARLVAASKTLSKIEHPNIERFYEAGLLEDGSAFVATEFVDGVSLRRLLALKGPLPIATVLAIVNQVAAGLGAARERGVVHGTVTPDNILVQSDTHGELTIKVTDFGLGSIFASATAPKNERWPGGFGSPSYAAPEQFLGVEIDARTDVYALGVITYELLTGHPPFEGSSTELGRKHRYTEPPRLATFGVWVPLPVEYVVMRALAKNRADRIASVEALARDLVDALASKAALGVAAAPPKSSAAEGDGHSLPPEHSPDETSNEQQKRLRVTGGPIRRAWARSHVGRVAVPQVRTRPRSQAFWGSVRNIIPAGSHRALLALLVFPLLAFAAGMVLGVRTTDRVNAQAPAEAPKAPDLSTAPAGVSPRPAAPTADSRRPVTPPRQRPASIRSDSPSPRRPGQVTGTPSPTPVRSKAKEKRQQRRTGRS
jgi:serine/threonine protein kinase